MRVGWELAAIFSLLLMIISILFSFEMLLSLVGNVF